MGALLRLDLASEASRLLAWPGLSSSVEPAAALAASVAASPTFFSSVLAGSIVSGTAKDSPSRFLKRMTGNFLLDS